MGEQDGIPDSASDLAAHWGENQQTHQSLYEALPFKYLIKLKSYNLLALITHKDPHMNF